ncbi:EC1118_1F14_0705p [Saccharomyces cerevisiae EC1118]|uniref:EC1118_1F14_0705p n=1 Tax=Saccharomyces cerevisiae (strain Lalvin EC1118 / Prise de mousse) TaxID=643680 RepID=C8Z7R8_YEAS8|nr:EC1118_1F14_0705p [Saccharomyces cerevisiae EC1118]
MIKKSRTYYPSFGAYSHLLPAHPNAHCVTLLLGIFRSSPFLLLFLLIHRKVGEGRGGQRMKKKRGRANPSENLRERADPINGPAENGKKGSVTCGCQLAVAMTTC